jgi:TolB-like protein
VWRAFVADVRRFAGRQSPATVNAQVLQPPPISPAPQSGAARRKPLVLALAAAALLVIAISALYVQRNPEQSKAAIPGTAVAVPATIAVLPFENLSGDPEQQYFSDGLTEEIGGELELVRPLKVINPRASSFYFKSQNEDLDAQARKHGVTHWLEGSVRRDDRRLRVHVNLRDVHSAVARWSRSYDRALDEVLGLRHDGIAIQQEIARDLAAALRVTLDMGEIRQAEGGTTDFEAWDRILQVTQLMFQDDPANTPRRQQLAREAVELDKDFSFGWFRLWQALSAGEEKEYAAKRVQELTPGSWWAGQIRFDELVRQRPRKWRELEALSRSIARLEGSTAATMGRNSSYASIMAWTGHVKELLRIVQRAHEADPQAVNVGRAVMNALDATGRPDLAEEQYRYNLTLRGGHGALHWWRLLNLLRSADRDSAAIDAQFATVLEDLSARPDADPTKALLKELARIHRSRGAVLDVLRRNHAQAGTGRSAPFSVIAQFADVYGDRDLALQVLREHIQGPYADLYFLFWYPWQPGLRADPRFKDIVRELGLVEYWREIDNWGDFCKALDDEDFECR